MGDVLASERVVVSAPMSFHGSAARIWRITGTENFVLKLLVFAPIALLLISVVWFFVVFWYLVFGILLVPYRLIRRGSRKSKRDNLRHREVLEALDRKNQ